MIELIEGFPKNVVAAIAKGEVTAMDYKDVLIPAIERTLKTSPRIRCYYELGPEFSGMEAGAMWEDAVVGLEHWSQWERIAVVSDIGWIAGAVKAFSFLIPCPVRIFPVEDKKRARAWIAEA
jgi:SpoIIAA-like